MFPVTTMPPAQDRLAVEIPLTEWKTAGLDARCWIMLDENNQASDTAAYDFESLDAIGQFGNRFLLEIAKKVRQAIISGRKKTVRRT